MVGGRGIGRSLALEALTLYRVARHPGTPWRSRLLAGAVAAYALCPLDLIPDFIPVLGLLDDLVLVPLGLRLALRWVPPPVLAECRKQALALLDGPRPVSRAAVAVIVGLWILGGVALVVWAAGLLGISPAPEP